MSTPATSIYICSDVKLNNRYDHTIYFEDRVKQREFFMSHVVKTYTKYTYLRKRWEVKVEATMAEARRWCYLFFDNPGERTAFYFITDIEYVNDEVVLLSLEMDVMQTYHFDYQMLPCFIERHHTPTDKVGEHTIDEGLDTGEFINAHTFDNETLRNNCVLVLTSVDFDRGYANTAGTFIDGVYSGAKLFAFDDLTMLNTTLVDCSNDGKIDGVVAMWMYPKALVQINNAWTDAAYHEVTGTTFGDFTAGSYTQHKGKLFEGYAPKCNKLYTYPYNYLYCTNNSGTGAVFRYEFFTNPGDAITFGCYGALTPDGTVKIAPQNYKGVSTFNYDEGISLGGFPSCAWNSDTYKVWLAQNQASLRVSAENIQVSAVMDATAGVLNAAGSIPTGNIGAALGGLGQTINAGVSRDMQQRALMAQVQDRSVQPAQSRGTFSSNVNVAAGRQTFSFYYKTLRKEYAKAIDNYLHMYGYKVNKVDTPSRKNRERFTFIKTNGCHIKGQMCDADTTAIERIFDKGVTFWTDGDQIGTYLDSNPTL